MATMFQPATLESMNSTLERHADVVDHRFDAFERRLDRLDHRFDVVDQHDTGADRRFDTIERQLGEGVQHVADGVDRLHATLNRLLDLHDTVDRMREELSLVKVANTELQRRLAHLDHAPGGVGAGSG